MRACRPCVTSTRGGKVKRTSRAVEGLITMKNGRKKSFGRIISVSATTAAVFAIYVQHLCGAMEVKVTSAEGHSKMFPKS